MLLRMEVKGITLDPLTNMPIVILKDINGSKALPIWIGIFEANAIALELEKIVTPRPMTHDLLKSVIEHLNAKLEMIVITELKNNTFYAQLKLINSENEVIFVDSRPSDAIALALRCGAPIFVEESVIEKAQVIDTSKDLGEKEEWKEWLERLKPEDFGKYPM